MNKDLPVDPGFYRNTDHWCGGYYELSMRFQPGEDDRRLLKTLEVIRDLPVFAGVWSEREDYPGKKTSFPASFPEECVERFYGCLQIRPGVIVGCCLFVLKFENGSNQMDFRSHGDAGTVFSRGLHV